LSGVDSLSQADQRILAGVFAAAKIRLSEIPASEYQNSFYSERSEVILRELSAEDISSIKSIELETADLKAAQLAESKTLGG